MLKKILERRVMRFTNLFKSEDIFDIILTIQRFSILERRFIEFINMFKSSKYHDFTIQPATRAG